MHPYITDPVKLHPDAAGTGSTAQAERSCFFLQDKGTSIPQADVSHIVFVQKRRVFLQILLTCKEKKLRIKYRIDSNI